MAFLALAGCAHTTVDAGFTDRVSALDPETFTCCADPEKFYPEGLVRTAFALSDELGARAAGLMYGGYEETGYPGRLAGDPAAESALLAQLQPLDIVLSANKSYLWGRLIPGRFTHNVTYLGTEAQLRRAGLWDHPGLAPLRDDIRAGRLFIEAVTPQSQTVGAAQVMEVDAVAIVRPRLSAQARREAYATFARNVGVPYDYTFDIATTDEMACTEIVRLAMPSLQIATREAYGRTVIFPDEIAAQAIRGERMDVVGYMVGTEGGHVWRNTQSLMGDIAAYWGLLGSNQ